MRQRVQIIDHKEANVEPKSINDRLESIELAIDSLIHKIETLHQAEVRKVKNIKKVEKSGFILKEGRKPTLLLQEIYNRKSVVSREELKAIAKTLGVKRVGPYFRGDGRSLVFIPHSDGMSVALTPAGYSKLMLEATPQGIAA